MKNPGLDPEQWERLTRKWASQEAGDQAVQREYRLIHSEADKDTTILLDVIQTVDDELVTETVQRRAGEADHVLGIAGLSMDGILETYKKVMDQLHQKSGPHGATLTVSMTSTSPTSGEVRAILELPDPPARRSLRVDYRHYSLLRALRDKMIEIVGDGWSSVTAVYRPGALDFFFEY
jgi:hypothetical protein